MVCPTFRSQHRELYERAETYRKFAVAVAWIGP